ncbi:MAG: hypothetical protein AABO41_16915 [Acidobacteriota bacterium]
MQDSRIPYIASPVAGEDSFGSAVVAENAPGHSKPMRVMLLEEGRVAFLGTREEFQTSTSRVVQRLTHPEAGQPRTGDYIADPWSGKRKLKGKLF